MRVPLGDRQVWKGLGSKRRCVLKNDHAIYVPVLKTLQNMLRNEAILAEVIIMWNLRVGVCSDKS